jgi:hypothetical protein
MNREQEVATTLESPETERFSFEVSDVTGTYTMTVTDMQPSLPAGTAAQALASRASLPDTPWALRDDRTAEFLTDDRPIGEQISPGARVTLTPKTHLGAA